MIDFSNDVWKMTSGPTVSKDEGIDLWRVFLNREPESVGALLDSLSPDEKRRANKYVFARDREHFIAARGTLRKVLGGYLGLGPEKIRFSYNRFGKPSMAAENGGLRFNVSHSNGIGVIAITLDREVGVDLEFVKHDLNVFSVACSAFSPNEVSRLRSLPSSLRTAAFFVAWTRKEACLKAMGDGLSSSPELQSLVSLINAENEVSFKTHVGDGPRDWSLKSISTENDFKIALAVEGMMGPVRYWQLSES